MNTTILVPPASVSDLQRECALNEDIIRAGRRAASKLLCDRTALAEAVEEAELLLSVLRQGSYLDHFPQNARADVFKLQRKLNKVLREHGGEQ